MESWKYNLYRTAYSSIFMRADYNLEYDSYKYFLDTFGSLNHEMYLLLWENLLRYVYLKDKKSDMFRYGELSPVSYSLKWHMDYLKKPEKKSRVKCRYRKRRTPSYMEIMNSLSEAPNVVDYFFINSIFRKTDFRFIQDILLRNDPPAKSLTRFISNNRLLISGTSAYKSLIEYEAALSTVRKDTDKGNGRGSDENEDVNHQRVYLNNPPDVINIKQLVESGMVDESLHDAFSVFISSRIYSLDEFLKNDIIKMLNPVFFPETEKKFLKQYAVSPEVSSK